MRLVVVALVGPCSGRTEGVRIATFHAPVEVSIATILWWLMREKRICTLAVHFARPAASRFPVPAE